VPAVQLTETQTPESPSATTVEVSVVLPCLNEEATVGAVVDEAFVGLQRAGVTGEVIVVDNGSTDDSALIAAEHGARVVREERRGYGSAYLAGLAAARGDLLVLSDADGTYPLHDLGALLEPLREGRDLVVGSRLRGEIESAAMPWSHRWLGNPLLTGTLNILFRAGVSDAHCGLRAVRRSALEALDLQTTGMEFASEMVVKAAKRGLSIGEVPISYRSRVGSSKLSPYRDAWRHVRFMLVHSPTFLFLIPGGLLFAIGFVGALALSGGPIDLFGRTWELHAMIFAAIATLVGAQIVQLGVFARTYAVLFLSEHDPMLEGLWRRFRLEHGLAVGAALFLAGLVLLGYVVVRWIALGFENLHEEHLSVLGMTLVGLGAQTIFASFFLSILGLRRKRT
jgi:glycosyltransferase involved in cell wall biosynthesis